MNETSVKVWTEESSDSELIESVREGDSTAFSTLFHRHAAAAHRVALAYSPVPSDADDIVSEAFERVLIALQKGRGPDHAFRAYLFTVVRRTGGECIRRAKQVRPYEDMAEHDKAFGFSDSSGESTLHEFERSTIADAFRSLPERWQMILWYTEIEKMTPAEVAPRLGLTPNGAASLGYRAREALRQAYLQQHLAEAEDPACLSVFDNLAAYVRGTLTPRERTKVAVHIATCAKCDSLISELEDVNGIFRG
jgi:RNA polymerase sigma factor (sigma-70 family)